MTPNANPLRGLIIFLLTAVVIGLFALIFLALVVGGLAIVLAIGYKIFLFILSL